MARRLLRIGLPLLLAAGVGLLLLRTVDPDEAGRVVERSPGAVDGASEAADARLEGVGDRAPESSDPPGRRGVEPPPTRDVEAAIVGRVVDAEGRPVPGVKVTSRHADGHFLEALVDSEGRYRLAIAWKGRYDLHARAHGIGTAEIEAVLVDRDGDTPAPPLVLRGPGWFEGVVVFPDGTPADGVEVEAAIAMERGGSWAASPEPGLIHSRCTTDAKGRFRASGLRMGPYKVTAPMLSKHDVTVFADHGQQDARLVLRAKRIRPLVRSASGHELTNVEVKLTRLWGDRKGWGFSRSRRRDEVLELWGLPGARDVILWTCDGYLPLERTFSFDTDAWTRDVPVVLTEDDGSRGTVALSLQREDGTPLRGLIVQLRSSSGIYRIARYGRVDVDADDVATLPPGRWTLEVKPRAALEDDYEGYDFPAHGTVEVVAGERRNLVLTSRLGGRVRLHVKRGPRLDPDADLSISVGLVVPPELEDDPERDYADLGWFDDDAPPLSQIVKPGRWLLEIEGEGVKRELRPLLVRTGRTLDVRAVLVPGSSPPEEESE